MARDTYRLQIVIDAMDKASKTLNKQQKRLGKWAAANKAQFKAVGLAAGAAFTAIGYGVYKAVKAFDKQQKVEKQLNAVLKSTKHAAGLTAKEVKKMAAAFQKATTFGDEEVLTGQNLLLTFTKIGKDVFPAATQVMLDMAIALDQDMKQSAIQLGKALNDPILGMTNLRRVGVNFSQAQVEVVKKMVETGDIASAQRLILKELQTEFGGSAEAARETFGGALKALKNTFGDLMEKVGKAVIPVLQVLMNYVQQTVLPLITSWTNNMGSTSKIAEGLAKVLQFITKVVMGVVGAVDIATSGIAALGLAMTGHFKAAKMGWEEMKDKISSYGDSINKISTTQIPKVKQIHIDAFSNINTKIAETGDKYKVAVDNMKKKTDEVIPTIEDVWKKSLDNISGRFGKWRDLVTNLGQAVTQALSDSFFTMFESVGKGWKAFGEGIKETMKSFKDAVLRAIADIAAKLVATKIFEFFFGGGGGSSVSAQSFNYEAKGRRMASAMVTGMNQKYNEQYDYYSNKMDKMEMSPQEQAKKGMEKSYKGMIEMIYWGITNWGKTASEYLFGKEKSYTEKWQEWANWMMGATQAEFEQKYGETGRKVRAFGAPVIVNVSGNTISSQLDLENLADTIGSRIVQAIKSERNF